MKRTDDIPVAIWQNQRDPVGENAALVRKFLGGL